MWGDEEREDTEEGTKEDHRKEQEGEDERAREEGRRNCLGGDEWQDGEGEQLKVAEDREQEKEGEQAKSQGESAEEVQVVEGEMVKEGELENGGAQQGSQELLQTTTPCDRQDEAGAKSQGDTMDSCTPAAEDNAQTFLSPESTPLLEDRTQETTQPGDENTRAAKNTHTSSSSGGTNSCDVSVHTPLSSAPPRKDRQTPHSERVN